ncbi:MAG: RNA polymerase sigma factor [Acidobacteriales bacterium]|nr:RNA polymerase sigma factor [Terriglobales bacterium]
MTDADLVRLAQTGDSNAFETLVHRHDRAVLRLALHLTGSPQDAQDVCQDAFLRVHLNLHRFRFQCALSTWLYRVVTNVCLDHLRRNPARRQAVTVVTAPDGKQSDVLDQIADCRPSSSPERSFDGTQLRRDISRALGKLSPKERMVFELKHYHGMKLRKVADLVGTTEGTAKNILFRTTKKLRVQLAGAI